MCHALQRGFIISEPLEYGLPQGAGICFHHILHNAYQSGGEPNGVLISVAFNHWHGRGNKQSPCRRSSARSKPSAVPDIIVQAGILVPWN